VGELQILTRASYVTLAVVPLLVGAWPSVRLVINNHNRVLERSTWELSEAGDKLSERVSVLARELERATAPLAEVSGEATRAANNAINGFASGVNSLSNEVKEELGSLRRQATLSPWLPPSWALAWFAALAIAVGHLLYQGQAPDIIRQNTRFEFVKRQREAFREQQHDDDFREALDKAQTSWWERVSESGAIGHEIKAKISELRSRFRQEVAGKDLYYNVIKQELANTIFNYFRPTKWGAVDTSTDEKSSNGNAQDVNGHIFWLRYYLTVALPYDRYWLQKDFENMTKRSSFPEVEIRGLAGPEQTIEAFIREVFGTEPFTASKETELNLKLDVIGEAARLAYNTESSRRRSAIVLALALYGLGFLILIVLIALQAKAVMQAAGWI
jgi:hypothetical protein